MMDKTKFRIPGEIINVFHSNLVHFYIKKKV